MAREPWEARLVAHLCESKRQGAPFEAAWREAMRAHPPRGRDLGEYAATLFDERGRREVCVADAMRGYCQDAWDGRRPALARFGLEMLREGDLSSSAQRVGVIKVAA